MCFRSPRMPPAPKPLAPPPEPVDQVGAADERARLRNMRGRAATLLTGGAGDTSAVSVARPAATVARMLLG
jgi:hypothetical protein